MGARGPAGRGTSLEHAVDRQLPGAQDHVTLQETISKYLDSPKAFMNEHWQEIVREAQL